MRRILLAAALLALAGSANAQSTHRSLRLNPGVAGTSYLTVVNKTGLENPNGYTIEAWIKIESHGNYNTIVGNGFTTGYYFGTDLTSGKLRFWPVGSDQGGVMLSASTIPLNNWTHVAATYDAASGTARLFINGVQDSIKSIYTGQNVSPAPGDLRLGADRSGLNPAYFFRGWLDEVRIWDEPRSQSQIAALRFDRVGSPRLLDASVYDGLVAYWDMEEPVGGIHLDRRAGLGEIANDASPAGGTQLAADTPPIAPNTAMQFSGLGEWVSMNLPDGFTFENGVTLEAWVAPQLLLERPEGVGYPGWYTIIGRNYVQSFWLGINPSGTLRFWPSDGEGFFEGVAPILPDGWTHVAATYRPGEAKLYINGELDQVWHDLTHPVGENGMTPRAGADSSDATDGSYPFVGLIDEARITRGVLSATQIRHDMFLSQPPLGWVPDELGVLRERRTASMEHRASELVSGPFVRLARSGAPLFGPTADLAAAALEGYTLRYDTETPGGSLPGGTTGLPFVSTLTAPSLTINEVSVFLSLTSSSLGAGVNPLRDVRISLTSPAATTIYLKDLDDGAGRDVQTVFDDDFPLNWITGQSPYLDGLHPTGALANFDGQNAAGTWTLEIGSLKGISAGLWAWGLSFNDVPLAVGEDARGFSLALAGVNPVREQGALRFTMPAAGEARLLLLDARGRRVRELLKGAFGAGEHHVTWNARGLGAGLYFLRLERSGGESRQLKVAVVR